MRSSYLEVTCRHGCPLTAYLYLPRSPGDKNDRVEQAGSGLLVDYTADGKPIGIEITAPAQVGIAELNRVLAALHAPAVTNEDIAPLRAALPSRESPNMSPRKFSQVLTAVSPRTKEPQKPASGDGAFPAFASVAHQRAAKPTK